MFSININQQENTYLVHVQQGQEYVQSEAKQ